MCYEGFKNLILQMMDQDYEAFVKALLSIELDIDDPKIMDKLYLEYMENDWVRLVDGFFL